MNNKIRYIISILLLAIFPISAIGIDISVHQCSGKNTKDISFNKVNPGSKGSCCCSGANLRTRTTMNPENNGSCSANYNKSDLKKIPCCKITSFYSCVSIINITSAQAKIIDNKTVVYIIDSFQHTIFEKNWQKEINYPLKEPINNIIAFIHYTSLSGDDTDSPYFQFS